MSNISQFNGSSNNRRIRYALYGPAGPVLWTTPSTIEVNEVLVVCVGGGGAGGAGGLQGTYPAPPQPAVVATGAGGGGGGSGAIVGYTYPVSAGTVISLTAGGTSGTSSANNPGPAPIPISASGGSSGSAGANGGPTNTGFSGGAAGAGGAATIPAPALTGNSFSAAGVAGRPGANGRSFPTIANPGIAYSAWSATGGSGGAGGIHYSFMNMLGITYSLTTNNGARYEANAGTATSVPWGPTPGAPAGSMYVTPWLVHDQQAGVTEVGVGGGGGAGGSWSQSLNNPSAISASSGSVGAVFILY